MKSFKDTKIWNESIELYREIVPLMKKLKHLGFYKCSEQIESSCGSISDNIAEGFGRGGNKELIQFLYIANGSCSELQNQFYRIEILGCITLHEREYLLRKAETISKQISAFINYLSTSDRRGRKFD